jgi:hypothetical protein
MCYLDFFEDGIGGVFCGVGGFSMSASFTNLSNNCTTNKASEPLIAFSETDACKNATSLMSKFITFIGFYLYLYLLLFLQIDFEVLPLH